MNSLFHFLSNVLGFESRIVLILVPFLDHLVVLTHFLKSFTSNLIIALESHKGIRSPIKDLNHNFLATEVMQLDGFSDQSSLPLVQCNFSPLFWHF